MISYRLLFVCTGNICRSPTAEGVMRHIVKREGIEKQFHIDSAGTQDYHTDEAPDPRSIATAARYGVDISQLKARQVKPHDYEDFDLILALDKSHYDFLTRQSGANQPKIKLFLPFSGIVAHEDVPDPYYGTKSDFDLVYGLIEQGCEALFSRFKNNLRSV